MSSSPIFPFAASATLASKAVPPYAGPRFVPGEAVSVGKVGPFVPSEARRYSLEPAVNSAAAAVTLAAEAPIEIAPVPVQPVVGEAVEMVVPSSIPPYRPLRPTPIVTPAIRTPLYIPPIPTPAGEPVVEDEGLIAPQLVQTSEFAVPTADEGLVAEEKAPDEAAADALPWIDAFLASTPVLPMEAVSEPAETVEAPDDVETDALDAAERDVAHADAVIAESTADEWPLDEAAAEFRALRSAMDEVAAHEQAIPDSEDGDAGLADLSAVPPLPAWSDDDLMDIMPIRHSGKTPLSNTAIAGDGDLWAERARKAHEEATVFRAMASARAERDEPEALAQAGELTPSATAEEAAHALELLARRVRAGELTLPSYDPRMGEPAALVAALAALLGVKLR